VSAPALAVERAVKSKEKIIAKVEVAWAVPTGFGGCLRIQEVLYERRLWPQASSLIMKENNEH
jgi:hypothetical protein